MGRRLVESAFLAAQAGANDHEVEKGPRKGERVALNHRAFRLLVAMANTALDTPTATRPARLYWRGRQFQAQALGYRPDEFDTAGARSNVSKAVSELRDFGFIQNVSGGYAGHATTYEVLLRGDFPSAELLPGRKGLEAELRGLADLDSPAVMTLRR